MSDKTTNVLRAIDDALDGADEDWNISGDAMRWAPPETPADPCTCTMAEPCDQHLPYPPDSLAADVARLNEAARELGNQLARPFLTFARVVDAALERHQHARALEVIVPEDTERAAYIEACDGVLSLAIEYASFGIPPGHVRDLRETGLTAMQFTVIQHQEEVQPTERSAT